jgi:hypothetical protein
MSCTLAAPHQATEQQSKALHEKIEAQRLELNDRVEPRWRSGSPRSTS